MILGAQAPGKVGHRQVTSEKTTSNNEVVFSVFCILAQSIESPGPGFPPFDPHCWSLRFGCSVALSSSYYRFSNTGVKYSRADDTWAQAPGKVESTLLECAL